MTNDPTPIRQRFAHLSVALRQRIEPITGVDESEAAEVEMKSGTVVHAFTSGTMVQVFRLAEPRLADAEFQRDACGAERQEVAHFVAQVDDPHDPPVDLGSAGGSCVIDVSQHLNPQGWTP